VKSPDYGYRLFFIIDGLDEFADEGTDRLDYEELAQSFVAWAGTDDTKILVSSRPYREFLSTFRQELRIHLHDINQHDILHFGHEMFKEHRAFSSGRLNLADYECLVGDVAAYSRGVFLWARLTIRSLLMAIARGDGMPALVKLLEETPKEINDLYSKMLGGLKTQAERVKAYKIICLSKAHIIPLSAIAITWIDELSDDSFPYSHEMASYSNEEVQSRLAQAAAQLDYYTNGLVEIVTVNPYRDLEANLGYFTKHLQFFHRTVGEYVESSESMRQFSVDFPEFSGTRMHLTVCLAEYWFAQSQWRASLVPRCSDILVSWAWADDHARQARFRGAYEQIMFHHSKRGCEWFKAYWIRLGRHASGMRFGESNTSYLHWLASGTSDWDYFEQKLEKLPNQLHADGEMSLVLTAALSPESPVDSPVLSGLFRKGASPNEVVCVRRYLLGEYVHLPVWMLFCMDFAAYTIDGSLRSRDRTRFYYMRMKDFLGTGEVDLDIFIFVVLASPQSRFEGLAASHVISMKDLLRQAEWGESEDVERLLRPPETGILGKLRGAWEYLSVKPEPLFRLGDYLPYRLGMPVPSESEDTGGEMSRGPRFRVHSAISGQTRAPANDIGLRLY
jgi:hypothetical protein